MPPDHSVRPHDGECVTGFRKQMADPTQDHPVDGYKWNPTGPAPSQHDNLLSQYQILGFRRHARPEQINDNPKN
jgi:hypothetical protein